MATLGMIDTDHALGTILGNFSSDYIVHVVEDSLNLRFRPFGDEMPNMVDVLERQFNAIYVNSPDYTDQVMNTKLETYQEIIRIICNYYNIQFTGDFDNIDPIELYGLARTLYDIFISRFTSFMIDFFTRYIINNSDSIYSMIVNDPNFNKPKDVSTQSQKINVDPKFIIIHANMNQVIYNMAGFSIDLNTLLSYFCDPETFNRLSSLLVDKGDIYKNYYGSFILDAKTTAEMITCIKLSLQGKTYEINNI